MNTEHPTSNTERRMIVQRWLIGCSVFNVLRSMFAFAAVLFAVAGLHAHASTNALPALAPPYGKMPPTFLEQHGTALIVGGFLFVALAGLFTWKMLRPRQPVVSPPEMVAREALAKLLARPEDGKCLSEISQILRRYVVAAFGLPPGEMTTAEFCAALAGSEKIGAELTQAISSFLHECDERKFARSSAFTRPEPSEGGTPSQPPLNAAGRALEMVNQAEQQRAKFATVKHD